MTDDQLNSLLQAEYPQLQKTIEDFDRRTSTITAWSRTTLSSLRLYLQASTASGVLAFEVAYLVPRSKRLARPLNCGVRQTPIRNAS